MDVLDKDICFHYH